MYELIILNLKTNEKFTKQFASLYLLDDFKKKCTYSQNIKIIGEFKI